MIELVPLFAVLIGIGAALYVIGVQREVSRERLHMLHDAQSRSRDELERKLEHMEYELQMLRAETREARQTASSTQA